MAWKKSMARGWASSSPICPPYRAEAHARDVLTFEVGVMDFNQYGGDIIFRITRPATKLVAMAKYGFVFFNYKTSKVTPMPPEFLAKFPHVNRLE
jgi:acyl-CoA thioesterase FadM